VNLFQKSKLLFCFSIWMINEPKSRKKVNFWKFLFHPGSPLWRRGVVSHRIALHLH
jgi:hypothetical protein